MRREFDHFWNTRGQKSPCFPGRNENACDKRGDLWNRESCFANVLQKSKIRAEHPEAGCHAIRNPQSPIRDPQATLSLLAIAARNLGPQVESYVGWGE
jgi:hypothetical protein